MANLPLLDPFATLIDYPDTILASLRSGHSTCTRFSPCGQYLASGRVDGVVVVFDVETRSVARKERGHVGQVQGVSWSGDGRWLVSVGMQDWGVCVWDLSEGGKRGGRRVMLGKAAFGVELSLKDARWAVACCFEAPPVLIDLTPGETKQYTLSSAPRRSSTEEVTEKQIAADAKQQTSCAVFTLDGSHILAGTSKGYLNIISVATRETLYSVKLCAPSTILSLRLSTSGTSLVLNCSDRVIRTLHLPDLSAPGLDADKIHLELEHRFSDPVNRLSWNHVAFSGGSGDFVLASTYNNHDVYIWERSHGSLVRILEGPKEEMGSVEWCPDKPLIAATSLESGRIFLWGVQSPQRWSALAPDFVEVEENVEYEEREDEFDIHPVEERRMRMLDAEGESVDVLSGGREQREWRMPIVMGLEEESEDEFVVVGAGTMRRKSPGTQSLKVGAERERRGTGEPESGTEGESGVEGRRKRGGRKK